MENQFTIFNVQDDIVIRFEFFLKTSYRTENWYCKKHSGSWNFNFRQKISSRLTLCQNNKKLTNLNIDFDVLFLDNHPLEFLREHINKRIDEIYL